MQAAIRSIIPTALLFAWARFAQTNASRMSVFIYLTPALIALGLHFFVRGERLAALQRLGVRRSHPP